MRVARTILALAAPLLATACAAFGPTPYGPATGFPGYGYSDERLADGRWRIQVHGNPSTGAATLRDQWFLRAAEIALAQGAEGFNVVGADGQPRIRPAFLMPQFGAAGFFRPLVRYPGYAPGVVPSRQLIVAGEIELVADTEAGYDAEALVRKLSRRPG